MTNAPAVEVPDYLVLANASSELVRAAEWVKAWAECHDVPGPTAGRLDLCVTELVTNVITHGCTSAREHYIGLRLRRSTDRVTLEIEDDGVEFDPVLVQEPPVPRSLEEARIGGLGIHLVRKLADDLRHRRSEGRNHLTLILRLAPP